jgi:hypothetical protein
MEERTKRPITVMAVRGNFKPKFCGNTIALTEIYSIKMEKFAQSYNKGVSRVSRVAERECPSER